MERKKNLKINLYNFMLTCVFSIISILSTKYFAKTFYIFDIGYLQVIGIVFGFIIVLLTQNKKNSSFYLGIYLFLLIITQNMIFIPSIIHILHSSKHKTKIPFVFGYIVVIATIIFNLYIDFEYYLQMTFLVILGIIYISRMSITFKRYDDKFTTLSKKNIIDPLTKTYNRSMIKHLEEKKLFEDKYTTVLLMDVDKFKTINDTYGHSIGDIVLVEIVKSIQKAIEGLDNNYVIRLGGDEFVVISNVYDYEDVIRKINKNIEDNKKLNTDNYKVTLSIGISKNAGYSKFSDFYDKADESMYRKKKSKHEGK